MESKGHILLLDDEVKLRELIARMIGLEGYTVTQAGNVREALRKMEQEEVQVLITDVRLPDGNGVELVQQVKEKYPQVEVLVMTAYGTIPDGVKAIKNGAFDYLVKGDEDTRIIPMLARAMDKARLQQRVQMLEQQLHSRQSFENIMGTSPAIRQSITLARKVAATDTTVLLTGETGTGKEIFAQAIHTGSSRSPKPFVAVNCGALASEILESELFGYKAGAFTGAVKDKKGLLEEAHKGTLFLDEAGEMSLPLQAKLLRFLETGSFIKVGDTREIKVDVRLIAATNRNLEEECRKGQFRLDLFYRISVFQIALPPLRDRKTDVPELASFYARQYAIKTRKPVPALSPAFLTALQNHLWKGNVRELKNVMERALILCDGDTLEPSSLPFDFFAEEHTGSPDALSLTEVEKNHIRRVLALTQGNKTEAARLLQIGLTTLYRKIEEYKL